MINGGRQKVDDFHNTMKINHLSRGLGIDFFRVPGIQLYVGSLIL